jgi:hypothetical protein
VSAHVELDLEKRTEDMSVITDIPLGGRILRRGP